MPTVPVRPSCVPLAGQAACIAALGSAVPGCGAVGCGGLGSGVLTCAVCAIGGRGASSVTARHAGADVCCCAGARGDAHPAGCVVGEACAGTSGAGGGGAACGGARAG